MTTQKQFNDNARFDARIYVAEKISGFDYSNQAWVKNGRYVRCGHKFACVCHGRLNEGQLASDQVLADILRQ